MVFWSSLYAKQRYDLLNSAAAAGLILRAVLVFLLFSILPARFVNLTTYGFIYLAVIWMDNFLVCVWSRRIFPDIRLRFSRFNAEKARQIFFFGVFTTISSSSHVLYDNLIQVLINLLWGPRYNAIYGIAAKFPAAMHRLFVEPTWTLTPTFTDLVARGEKDKIKLLYFMYAKAVVIVSLPVVLGFICLSKPIIALWVGPDFSEAAAMMSILMVPMALSMPVAVAGCVYIAYAKVKVPSFVITSSVLVQLALSITLAKFFSLGIVGISIAEAAVALAVSGLFSAYYSCKISGLSLKEFWTRAYLPPFLWACLTTGTGILFYRSLYGNALTMNAFVVLMIAVWTALYAAGVYKLTLNSEEKHQIRSLPGLVFNRLNPSAGN
jgi:O-antigen/teichoic acid export membrane protein